MNIFVLVNESRRILSYHKLPKDAVPPKSMWHSIKKCEEWIEEHMSNDKSKPKRGTIDLEDWERE